MKKPGQKKLPKLTGQKRDLASKFIAEEMETGKYPHKQAIAIGISRARKSDPGALIHHLGGKYGLRAK